MIAPWPPTRYSEPLTVSFPSVFARFRGAFRIAWRVARGYELEAWQEQLLEWATELDPATGRLRRRRVLISLGRQNGKTEIAAALGLLFLLWKASPLVIGIASSAEQARLVYDRTMTVIRRNPALAAQFEALTDTRGIRAKDGGKYEIKAAKSAALQGPPVDLGIVDEVHLVTDALWTDLVNGTGGRADTLVVGITTAGDDASTLLKRLYEETGDAPGGFGFAIWEAPASEVPKDDETLARYLEAANPSIASGRVDVAVVVEDVRSLPEQDVIRYRLNRFVASTGSFISPAAWAACAWGEDEDFPTNLPVVFTIDRTPEWTHATVTATVKDTSGMLWTETVATYVQPSLDSLLSEALRLPSSSATFAMDGYPLADLAKALERNGRRVHTLRQGDVVAAASTGYSKIVRGQVRHPGDPVVAVQLPHVARKNAGDAFKLSRTDSAADIDAVLATVFGMHVAETLPPPTAQIF